jgi:hypothetical protein
MELVVRDSAVELNGVFQLLHRNVKTLEEQSPGLAGQHLRGLIRTRVQQMISECIELRLSSTRQDTGRFKDSAVELNGVFQLLHRNVKTLEEQSPGLAGDAQRSPVPVRIPGALKRCASPARPGDCSSSVLTFRCRSILTGTGETQFDALGDHLLYAGADQAAQMLAIAEAENDPW